MPARFGGVMVGTVMFGGVVNPGVVMPPTGGGVNPGGVSVGGGVRFGVVRFGVVKFGIVGVVMLGVGMVMPDVPALSVVILYCSATVWTTSAICWAIGFSYSVPLIGTGPLPLPTPFWEAIVAQAPSR